MQKRPIAIDRSIARGLRHGASHVLWLTLGCGSGAPDAAGAPERMRPSDSAAAGAGAGPAAGAGGAVEVRTTATSGSGAQPDGMAVAVTGGTSSAGPGKPAADGGTISDAPCDALGTDDACAACVCEQCSGALQRCADTAGCSDILACVRDSGCSGRDCYCGEASLGDCLGGAASGPCKDVVLAAPGSKEPSLADPSGGPASDAALEIASCVESETCGAACNVQP